MKKEMVGNVPGTVLGMLADLCHKLQHGVLTEEQLGKFLKKENPFVADNIATTPADWQQFYRKFFGIDLDLSSVKIPERKPGFDRPIVVAEGLTLNQVYDVCAKQFPCWRCTDDLDKAVTRNDRNPTQTYAVWVRDRQEADEENKNLSANQLKQQRTPGITLLERLLLELAYWEETGNHLDIQMITLCPGSRYSGGRVPYVYWYGDYLGVNWCHPDDADDNLRSRSVVSS